MDAKLLEHMVHVRQAAHLAGAINTLVGGCCVTGPPGARLTLPNYMLQAFCVVSSHPGEVAPELAAARRAGAWRAQRAERQLTDNEATVCRLVLEARVRADTLGTRL